MIPERKSPQHAFLGHDPRTHCRFGVQDLAYFRFIFLHIHLYGSNEFVLVFFVAFVDAIGSNFGVML